MKLEKRSETYYDVISAKGDVIGHIEKTSETHQVQWVVFDSQKTFLDLKTSHSPEQALLRFSEYLQKEYKIKAN